MFTVLTFILEGGKQLKVSFWDCPYESNKMDEAEERENVAPNQEVFFPLIIVKKYKRQWSGSRAEFSGDHVSHDANLSG